MIISSTGSMILSMPGGICSEKRVHYRGVSSSLLTPGII